MCVSISSDVLLRKSIFHTHTDVQRILWDGIHLLPPLIEAEAISHFPLFLFFFLSTLGMMKQELVSVNMKESLSKLTDHSSSKLASQASSILAILGDTS